MTSATSLVPHQGLPSWATALGILPLWATTLGILPSFPAAAGTWPHRQVLPTVGGYGAICTFLEKFDSTIYFSKIMTK
jgi:hypothetical protein